MKSWMDGVREKTFGMNKKEVCTYILGYYWQYILTFASIIALILLFTVHYAFGNKKPVFTCIMVNQETDLQRDEKLAHAFAEEAGLPQEQIVIDSSYQFSYDQMLLESVNESSYEKFFFQWENQEIDAVILSEDFYQYCKSMRGRFRELDEADREGFTAYMDNGVCTAVILGYDSFTEKVNGKKDEKLLLAFPSTGKNVEQSRQFLRYLSARQ